MPTTPTTPTTVITQARGGLVWVHNNNDETDHRTNLTIGAEIAIDSVHGREHKCARVIGLAWSYSNMQMRVHARTVGGTEIFVAEEKVVLYED